jgi:F-type H+-transporting ATPase subunit epsilon
VREDRPKRLKVSVISPTTVGFEGEGDSVVAPAYDGLLGILPGHAPMMVLLGTGEVVVTDGSAETRVRVSGGFLQVIDDQVSVLAESVADGGAEAGAP